MGICFHPLCTSVPQMLLWLSAMVVFLLAPMVCFNKDYRETKLLGIFVDHAAHALESVFNRAQGDVGTRAHSLGLVPASHPCGSEEGSINMSTQLQRSWFGGWNW